MRFLIVFKPLLSKLKIRDLKEKSPVVQKPAANTDNHTASFLLFQNTEMFPLQPFRHGM